MHFLQAINSDINVLIVCKKSGGSIKGDLKKKNWNCGREFGPVILRKFYMRQIYDMGSKALLFRIFSPLILRWFQKGLKPANLGNKSQHSTPRQMKTVFLIITN